MSNRGFRKGNLTDGKYSFDYIKASDYDEVFGVLTVNLLDGAHKMEAGFYYNDLERTLDHVKGKIERYRLKSNE